MFKDKIQMMSLQVISVFHIAASDIIYINFICIEWNYFDWWFSVRSGVCITATNWYMRQKSTVTTMFNVHCSIVHYSLQTLKYQAPGNHEKCFTHICTCHLHAHLVIQTQRNFHGISDSEPLPTKPFELSLIAAVCYLYWWYW